ncbi:MAG: hypothetical protein A3K20_04830 [Alphaproteobacteria bacterium GWA1_45_9]|nr:MAG: hypothetical protein A2065_02480 [Alphaproteobacteria bacterium GWB1_45_5]OFW76432.1 MAG: hypothetical protein A3K20_04830 [Alphaproteobacteria bacterium GWA1_45_9]HCI48912.1 hypothetical protein [Holosporales bacterium]
MYFLGWMLRSRFWWNPITNLFEVAKKKDYLVGAVNSRYTKYNHPLQRKNQMKNFLLVLVLFSVSAATYGAEAEREDAQTPRAEVHRSHPVFDEVMVSKDVHGSMIHVPTTNQLRDMLYSKYYGDSVIPIDGLYSEHIGGMLFSRFDGRDWIFSVKKNSFKRIMEEKLSNWVVEGPYPILYQVASRTTQLFEESCRLCGSGPHRPCTKYTYVFEAAYKIMGGEEREPIWGQLILTTIAKEASFFEEFGPNKEMKKVLPVKINVYSDALVSKNGSVTVGGPQGKTPFIVQEIVGPEFHDNLFFSFEG